MSKLLPSPHNEYGSFCRNVAYNQKHQYESYVLTDKQRSMTEEEDIALYGKERVIRRFTPTALVHNLTLDVWFAVEPGTGSRFDYVPNPIAEKIAAESTRVDQP